MTTHEQPPRSALTATALRLSLLLGVAALTACSGVEDDTEGALGDGYGGETDPNGSTTGSSDTGTDESTGTDGDTGVDPTGSMDPQQDLDLCDPGGGQVMGLDLSGANDELAATLVRESVLVGDGKVPRIPLSARPFLNHFDFGYAPAQGSAPEVFGELWKPSMQLNADMNGHYRLQFAVRSPVVDPQQRPPVDLAVVVDLGPSMAGLPLELAEETLAVLQSSLRPGDRVSLISAGEMPVVLVDAVEIVDPNMVPLTGMLMQEDAPGYAKVAEAVNVAYQQLDTPWEGQGQKRVVLVSNGHFMASPANVDDVRDHAEDGVYLLAVGVGESTNFTDPALRELTGAGRGSLLYAGKSETLWHELGDGFTGHMIATLSDVEVTLELPPGLGLSPEDLADGSPSGEPSLAMAGSNDSLVFHYRLEGCSELDPESVIRVQVEWTDPMVKEAGAMLWELPLNELGYGSSATRKGAAAVAYTKALIAYRDAGGVPSESYGLVLEAISLITEALSANPDDPELIEMSEVLAKLEG